MKKYLFKYNQEQLNLKNTLINGQCFNWFEHVPNVFSGVVFNRYCEIKRLDPNTLEISVQPDIEDIEGKFDIYFHRKICLKNIYDDWIKKQEKFKDLALKLPGTRVLKQDPWECTISFICSSNNNISRITSLLTSLKSKYGKKLCEKNINGKLISYHQFPSIQQLIQATEDDLKAMGFGYRASFIVQSVKTISQNGGQKWIKDLETKPYQNAKQQLMTLKGIGRKVADCICLFSLGCHDAVPIDTHMFQIAKKLGYIKQGQVKKSLSETLYRKIAQSYQNVYGQYAGWAQQIIFTGDLASYKSIVEKKQMDIQYEVPIKMTKKK